MAPSAAFSFLVFWELLSSPRCKRQLPWPILQHLLSSRIWSFTPGCRLTSVDKHFLINLYLEPDIVSFQGKILSTGIYSVVHKIGLSFFLAKQTNNLADMIKNKSDCSCTSIKSKLFDLVKFHFRMHSCSLISYQNLFLPSRRSTADLHRSTRRLHLPTITAAPCMRSFGGLLAVHHTTDHNDNEI